MKKLVISSHLLLLLALFSNPDKWIRPHFQKVAIHLKKSSPLNPKNTNASDKKIKSATPSSKPVSKPKSALKPPVSKATSAKKPATKIEKKEPIKKTPVAKPLPAIKNEKETIDKIAEKIDKLEQITKGDTKQTSSTDLTYFETEEQSSFSKDDVIAYLFEMLELPGPGKVDVELKLDRVGKIDEVIIIDSENPENSIYLIKQLKDVILPFERNNYIPQKLRVCFSNLKA